MILTKKQKNDFDDILGVTITTGDKWLDKKLNQNICYKSGGGPQYTESTVTQTDIPEEFMPYALRNLERAESEYLRPYTPYDSPRLAGLSQDTEMANQLIRNLATTGQPGIADAMDATRMGTQFAIDAAYGQGAQPFQYSQYGFNQMDFRDPYQFEKFDYSDVQKFTDEGVMDDYMSPYMQAVVDRQKKALTEDFKEQSVQRESDIAKQTGGLEGSRAFLVQQAAESDYLDRMADLEATGQEKAFEMAMQQFAQDREAGMTQEQRRYMEMSNRMKDQAAEFARAGDQEAAERARVQAAEAAELARVQGAQATEDRLAAKFGLDAMDRAVTSAGQLAKLEQLARAGDVEAATLLGTIGKEQSALEQAALDLQYEDFIRQRDYGKDQLRFFNEILRGTPMGTQTIAQRAGLPTNPAQTALGAGLGAIGLQQYLSRMGGY
tara:strand:- start:170 stop:1480 length:1311 start_codon:yes stop_codon:yes gene_type:complete